MARVSGKLLVLASVALLSMCGSVFGKDRRVPKRGSRAPLFLLPARRWDPKARKSLEQLITELGRGTPGYSPSRPPVAVFAWDSTAVVHSPGEIVFARLVTRAEFKFSDAFWALVPAPFGPRAKMGYEGFKNQPQIVWRQDPYYGMYRKAMFSARRDLCAREGPRVCAAWTASLLAGFKDEEAVSTMKTAVDEEALQPLGLESIAESPGDEAPIPWPTGLRPVPEIRDLIRLLLDHGFDVWSFSTSNQWAAQESAARFGIDPSRVIGVRCRVRNGVLQSEILDPIPADVGQAEALTLNVGRGPDLVVGGPDDRSLMEYGGGAGVRLALDPGDAAFEALARSKHWLIQRSFIPPEARESR